MPKKQIESKELIEAIRKVEKFAIKQGTGFDFYPFSNEKGFGSVIRQLQEDKPQPTKKLRVALIFGESHILSMLHTLSNYVDVVILADIEPKLHYHTQHMLQCLRASNTIDEYIQNYKKDNPVQSLEYHKVKLTSNQIADQHFFYNKSLVGDSYFLSTQEVFFQNKAGLNAVDIIHISLNLGDSEHCTQLANLVNAQGEIVLCNFSNIHDYFVKTNDKANLVKSISSLANFFPQSKVMYANGFNDGEPADYLKSNLVTLSEYLKNVLKHDVNISVEIDLGLFFKIADKKDIQHSDGTIQLEMTKKM